MRKIVFLWIVEILLGVCSGVALLRFYNAVNILSLYLLLFAPSIITAILFAIMIKSKIVDKAKGNLIYAVSGVFALIGTAVFAAMNYVVQTQRGIFSVIIENTRNSLSDQYLVVKESSSIVDYIMIFVLIFIIFWIIGHARKEKER